MNKNTNVVIWLDDFVKSILCINFSAFFLFVVHSNFNLILYIFDAI